MLFKSDNPNQKYAAFFKPAKYLIPAAIFTAVLISGCDDAGAGAGDTTTPTEDNTTDTTTTDPSTIIDAPSFNAPVSITGISSFSSYIFIPALADMDDDGDLDIIAGYKYLSGSSFELSFKYFKNETTSGLNFSTSNDLSNLPEELLPDTFSSGAFSPYIPALFDNDGDKDLIYSKNFYAYYPGTDKSQNIIYKAQNTSNTFAAPSQDIVAYHSFSAIALVDIDGDGDLDLVKGSAYQSSSSYSGSVYSQTKKISYLLNQGTDDFSDTTEHTLVAATSITDINQLPVPSFVDIDNDGDMDMFVVEYNSGNIEFYLNEGTSSSPSFTLQTGSFSVLPSDSVKYFPAFGDMDGDTDMDVIVGTDDGRLLFIENTDID